MAVSMVTVPPHAVEDFSDPGSLSPGIQRSPVKLLNPLSGAPKACKRRLEDLSFGGTTEDDELGLEDPSSKSQHFDTISEELTTGKEDLESIVVVPELNKVNIDKMYQVPALNSQRDFPCIWLGDTSPSRSAEGGDRSPNPASQASPRESQEAPSSISPPNLTSSMASVGPTTPMKASMEHTLSLSHPFNFKSPVSNGVLSNPPPLLEREPSLDSSPDGENMPVEVCPECHKVFKRKVYLQRHMEREHWSTAKVFKCDDCSYETKHQSNLSVHRRTHTGERPYHCGACGQRYTQGHLLKSHIRSRHGGNMEFYNLDKKSESTRGRKSLDMKHDPSSHGLNKVDKISTLLQVAAANQQLRPPQTAQAAKFGNLLAPPVSGLSPFFGTMRPMMTPSLGLPNGLLTAPRFFPALGGLPGSNLQYSLQAGGMLPTMQQSLQMLANQNNITASMNFENARQSAADVMRAQQKMAELDSPPFFPAHTPSPPVQSQASSVSQLQHPSQREADEEDADAHMPQDLSTTKKMNGPTLRMDLVEPQDLSGGVLHQRYEKEPGEVVSSMEMASEPEDLVMQNTASLQQSEPSQNELCLHKTTAPDLKKAAALLALNLKECRGANCLYARQLRNLRKNVLRMLSVFTPDLGVENGIDYETDTVDQLLHEVIYSNIDEEPLGKD